MTGFLAIKHEKKKCTFYKLFHVEDTVKSVHVERLVDTITY